MKALFLDCFSGISGDMFLSALLDAGLDRDSLLNHLSLLKLDGYDFDVFPVKSHGIKGTRINIQVKCPQPHRHLEDIINIISGSALTENIKKIALNIFYCLAEAEARVHGISLKEVHFHEVGAVDSILDIVGAAVAIDLLKPDIIYANTLSIGGGYVQCRHGTLPVPAPATAELLKGLPVRMGPVDKELVTPTGAAIVKTLVDSFDIPELKVEQIGYGFGNRETGLFNALRVMIGTVKPKLNRVSEEIGILECNVDDINPEFLPYLQENLFTAGALDVYIQSIVMKKGRLGFQIKVICLPGDNGKLAEILLRESTTLGVRYRTEKRFIARRKVIKVSTPYGNIGIKVGFLGDGDQIQCAPEFEDCKVAAKKHNIPLKEVYRVVLAEFGRVKISDWINKNEQG